MLSYQLMKLYSCLKTQERKVDMLNFIIAGPCAISSSQEALDIAHELKTISLDVDIPIIYKGSFDKANRSDLHSPRGVGLHEGLAILEQIKNETGLEVSTDVHEMSHIEPVAAVCDMIQIPALLSRQTDLIVTAAATGRKVNVKYGQCLAVNRHNLNMLLKKAGLGAYVTYRGTAYGGSTLIDYKSLHTLVHCYSNMIFDASHSIHDAVISEQVASAALRLGIGALFFEVHPDPQSAICDGRTSVRLGEFKAMVKRLQKVETVSSLWQ